MKKLATVIAVLLIILVACGKKDVTIDDVTKSFKDNQLAVKDLREMKKEDYGLAPMKAEKAFIFTVVNDQHARLFKFKDEQDLKDTEEYYKKLGESSAIFASHLYKKGDFLIQANGDISDDTFNKYKKVMEKAIEE